MEVAGLVGYDDRTLLKNGLGSALAKSKFEIEVFNEAFEQYFGAPSSDKSKSENPSSGTDDSSDGSPSSEELGEQLSQAMQAQPELAKNLSSELVDALKSGDEAAIAIAVETAAQQVDVSAIKLLTQRGQYIRKMLDALGEQALRDAAVELESTEPAAFEAVQALREQLRNKVRDRVDRAYMVHASGDAEDRSVMRLQPIQRVQGTRIKWLVRVTDGQHRPVVVAIGARHHNGCLCITLRQTFHGKFQRQANDRMRHFLRRRVEPMVAERGCHMQCDDRPGIDQRTVHVEHDEAWRGHQAPSSGSTSCTSY